MYSNQDLGYGVIMQHWADVRDKICHIEPEFTRLVDAISPSDDYRLYLLYFPYGAQKGDHDNYFHGCDGRRYRLKANDLPKIMQQDLKYGADSTPMGMVVDKVFEYYIPPLQPATASYPWRILYPGSIFPIGRLFRNTAAVSYTPNNLLSVCAGARTTFVLQNIASLDFHSGLETMARTALPFPKHYADHWSIFKTLTQLDWLRCDWQGCLMYFSEPWVKSIYNDPAWLALKTYLINRFWQRTEFDRATKFYASAFSLLKKGKNIQSDRYIEQTTDHLFSVALGEEPGFAPAMTNCELPIEFLTPFFSSHYRLKNKKPIFMVPRHFHATPSDDKPVYYSMHFPTVRDFSSHTRKQITAIEEVRKIKKLLTIYSDTIKNSALFTGTVYKDLINKVAFNFYHNLCPMNHDDIMHSLQAIQSDHRFSSDFTSTAKFMRGCIAIRQQTHQKTLPGREPLY